MPAKALSLNKHLFKLFLTELWRNKQGLAFLVSVPVVFLWAALYTASDLKLFIRLYNVNQMIRIALSHKQIILLYITAAVIGFLCAYYAMIMFQESLTYFKYCSFMGMPLLNYLLIRMLFFVTIVGLLSLFICLITGVVIPIKRPLLVFLGYLFMGFIYGLYGGIVGVITRNFLHSLLMIIMLANLDVGWLQNPVFYTYADNTLFIRFLPAFFPCQFIFTSAYTNIFNLGCALISLLYIVVLFFVLLLLLTLRIKGTAVFKKTRRSVSQR